MNMLWEAEGNCVSMIHTHTSPVLTYPEWVNMVMWGGKGIRPLPKLYALIWMSAWWFHMYNCAEGFLYVTNNTGALLSWYTQVVWLHIGEGAELKQQSLLPDIYTLCMESGHLQLCIYIELYPHDRILENRGSQLHRERERERESALGLYCCMYVDFMQAFDVHNLPSPCKQHVRSATEYRWMVGRVAPMILFPPMTLLSTWMCSENRLRWNNYAFNDHHQWPVQQHRLWCFASWNHWLSLWDVAGARRKGAPILIDICVKWLGEARDTLLNTRKVCDCWFGLEPIVLAASHKSIQEPLCL